MAGLAKKLCLLLFASQISCNERLIEPKVVSGIQNNFNGLIVLKTDALCVRYSKNVILCGSSDGTNQSCFVRVYLP
jgi:hypothetical protein